MTKETHKNLAVLQFATLDEWISWLDKNFDKCLTGIWVKIAKKNKGVTTTTYEDVREGCLMYGWIDSLPNKYDDIFYLLKVTPRRPKSVWSKINRNIIEDLIQRKKMQPSGLKEVTEAKNDGRWDKAY